MIIKLDISQECKHLIFKKDPWTNQRRVELRVGGGGHWGRGEWWGEIETTVLEQQ